MDEDACPTCGKPLGSVEIEARHVDHHGHEVVDNTEAQPRLPRTVGLTVLAALVLTVVGVFALTGGDDPDPAPDEAAVGVPDVREAGDGEVIEADSVRAQRELEEATAALTASIGDHRLAYVSEDGVVVVELGSLGERQAVSAEVAVTSSNDVFFDLADYELLNEGNSTFAIHRGDSTQVFELATIGPLVRTEDAFSIGKQLDGTRDEIVVATAAGFWITWVELPVGATTIAVPELGVLVLPPTGGTFLARPGKLEPFSDHRIIGATSTHQIEVRCDQENELRCIPVLLERATGFWSSIPDAFAAGDADVSISPDGRWVALMRPGSDLLLEVGAARVTEVELTDGALAWAPDGRFLAWLPPGTGAPILNVYQPLTGERAEVDLTALGGPERAGDAVVVFR